MTPPTTATPSAASPTASPPAMSTRAHVVRLDLNESAYPPLPSVAEVLREQVARTNLYPEFLPHSTRRAVARHLGVDDSMVSVGPGATGVALQTLHAAVRNGARRGVDTPELVTATPTFDGFPILADMAGLRMRGIPLDARGQVDLTAIHSAIGSNTVAVIICSPHNPTGAVVDEDVLVSFLNALPPHLTVIIDEAYIEFSTAAPDLAGLLHAHLGTVVLRTFSKAYGLAALRVGYGVGNARVMAEVQRLEVPFAVGAPAQAAVPVALAAHTELAQRVTAMRTQRTRLAQQLHELGAETLTSEANFVYLQGDDGIALGSLLTTSGIPVKQVRGHGARVTVGDGCTTEHVLAALRATAATA